MCYCITAAVPEAGAHLLENAPPRGMIVFGADNSSIRRHLPETWRTYAVTSGFCSCTLYRDPARERAQPTHDLRKLERKYRRKGWPEGKIQRALADAKRAAERPRPRDDFRGIRPDVIAFFSDVASQTGALAVIVHWYHGAVETESFQVQEVRMSSCSELANLKPDQLARIDLGRRKRQERVPE